ncbi:dethiobiotin synthase [soil metagenome]
MNTLAITATGTDVGKTFVACALIRAIRAKDRAVSAFKPALSGFAEDALAGSDAGLLLAALGEPMSGLDRMSPLRFAAPLAPPSAARAEGVQLTLESLRRLCRARMEETGESLLLIEGAGGLMSPLAEDGTNLDLFADLDLPLLLVTGSYLGAISHTLTALEAIKARGLTLAAIVISESDGEHPPPAEIIGALATFAPEARVFVAPRGGEWDAADLADAL